MKRQKMQVLLNPSSRRAEGALPALAEILTRGFAEHGVDVTIVAASGEQLQSAAGEALQRARKGELAAIIAAGGDGTIRTVAGELASTSVPLGIIPLGTLNHFAKDLGIPLELDDAIATTVTALPRAIDLGEVNGRTFVNNSSVGIYPYLVVDRERKRRHDGLSKWTAMVLAILRSIRRLPMRRLRIHVENEVHEHRSPCIFVGNNEYELGPREFGTRRTLSSGQLWLYIARQETRVALAWLALKSIFGLLDQQHDLQPVKVAAFTITSRRRRLLVAMDGEVELIRSPLHYRTNPSSLLVMAPVQPEKDEPARDA